MGSHGVQSRNKSSSIRYFFFLARKVDGWVVDQHSYTISHTFLHKETKQATALLLALAKRRRSDWPKREGDCYVANVDANCLTILKGAARRAIPPPPPPPHRTQRPKGAHGWVGLKQVSPAGDSSLNLLTWPEQVDPCTHWAYFFFWLLLLVFQQNNNG